MRIALFGTVVDPKKEMIPVNIRSRGKRTWSIAIYVISGFNSNIPRKVHKIKCESSVLTVSDPY